jgi:hypothetical protein
MENDPKSHPQPPSTTRLQRLPFGEITWEDFERLCLRLARLSSEVDYCRPYGVRGQSQGGIDLYARRQGDEKYAVYQCKRENDFTPAKIEAAVSKFLAGNWVARAHTFVLCTKDDLRTTQRSEAIELQTTILAAKGVKFAVWDATELDLLLKTAPLLVDDFFGRSWTNGFCESIHSVTLSSRIDGPHAADVRRQLSQLYSALLKTDDPGFALGTDQTYLPLEQRYVIPDILTVSVQSESAPSASAPPERSEQNSESLTPPRAQWTDRPSGHDRRAYFRQSVDQWLRDKKTAVILAGPGVGKSSLVRFLATDILSDTPRLAALGELHRNRLPVIVPFGFWTTLMSADSAATLSLEDVIEKWLHQLGSSDLWPAAKTALNDQRLALLVDGIDEYHSESTAAIALKQLQLFAELKRCTVIVTSRPAGFRRLPKFSAGWISAHLAPFTISQQRDFISHWVRFRLASSDNQADDGVIAAQTAAITTHLQDDIARNAGLQTIAETPLLLGVLVFLNRSGIPLPHNRFQAYHRIVQHLIVEHPQTRRVAASINLRGNDLDPDNYRRVLAALAYEICVLKPEGALGRKDAQDAIRTFLRDETLGLGFDPTSAQRAAQSVVADSERTFGLLIERASGLCAFIHRGFQEYLCAAHINSFDFDEQLKIISEHAPDPQWREVILGVVYMMSRPSDVSKCIDRLRAISGDVIASYHIETILCEIAMGPFQCPQSLCAELFERFASTVETGPWMPHRLALLRILLSGIHSAKVRQLLKKRVAGWYPGRGGWSSSVLPVLADDGKCSYSRLLLRAIHNPQADSTLTVSDTIARHCKDAAMAEDLRGILAKPCALPTIRSVSNALLEGWISHPLWNDLEHTLRGSHSIDLRLLAIRRRIRMGTQNEEDLGELMWLISNGGPFSWRGEGVVVEAIIEGWPGDVRIRNAAIASINPRIRVNPGLGSGPAARLLIGGYATDPLATQAIAHLIQTEQYAFTESHQIWKLISTTYQGNQQLIAAADVWLKTWSNHRYPEASFAARLGWTPTAKNTLITNLAGSFPFWSADALVEGWGIDDAEVKAALTQLLSTPYAAQIAHLFNGLISDRDERFKTLVKLLEADFCRDPARVAEALAAMANVDERETVVTAALPWARRPQVVGAREHVVVVLVDNFSSDPRVLALGREEMKRREGAWSQVLARFRHDADILESAIQMAAPLPGELRAEVVPFLSLYAHSDGDLLDLLRTYDCDADPEIKTAAAISYARALMSAQQPTDDLITEFRDALTAGGFDFESRRQAAFCGLDTLGRVDVVKAIRAERQDSIPIPVMVHNVRNEALITRLLSNWERLREALGQSFSTTFTRSSDLDDLYWWSQLADFVDEYSAPRAELLSILEETTGVQLYAELLWFLARQRPQSALLKKHCLNVIRNHGQTTGRWIEIEAAAILLGRDFAADATVLDTLVTLFQGPDSQSRANAFWALCEGWSNHKIVDDYYSAFKAQRSASGKAVATMLDMTLVCCKATPAELLEVLVEFVSWQRDDMSLQASAYIRPIVRRVSADAEMQALLFNRLLNTDSPSERISFSGLLASAVGLTDQLKTWALPILTTPETPHFYSSVGFDLTSGGTRTVWDKALELLQAV